MWIGEAREADDEDVSEEYAVVLRGQKEDQTGVH